MKEFKDNGLMIGRMISPSKSSYRDAFPNHVVVFNANAVTVTNGKIWYGDLDITRDADKLRAVAKAIGEPIFILREMDCRFDNEKDSASELLKKAVWNTTMETPTKHETV